MHDDADTPPTRLHWLRHSTADGAIFFVAQTARGPLDVRLECNACALYGIARRGDKTVAAAEAELHDPADLDSLSTELIAMLLVLAGEDPLGKNFTRIDEKVEGS